MSAVIIILLSMFTDIDVVVHLRYVDAKGNNIHVKDLKVFYLIDNQLVSPRANLGHETGFSLDVNGELSIFPHIPKDKGPATTILRFNEKRQDTLTTFYQFSKGSVVCSKVLYNRTLKWDLDSGKFPALRKITVVMNND
jgi:hypothetical protein